MITQHPIIDSILGRYSVQLSGSFESYRNHVYRVYNLAIKSEFAEKDLQILAVAAAFHDLGIWTASTFDYISPSVALAKQFAEDEGIDVDTLESIITIITEHHKIRPEKTYYLAEIFRQADLIDLSIGAFRFGRSRTFITEIRKTFPNKGFHVFLTKLFFKNLVNHPFKPLPMYKW